MAADQYRAIGENAADRKGTDGRELHFWNNFTLRNLTADQNQITDVVGVSGAMLVVAENITFHLLRLAGADGMPFRFVFGGEEHVTTEDELCGAAG